MNGVHEKAFTLLELLVVIAIIGLLSSVVLGSLNNARKNSRDSARMQAAIVIIDGIIQYHVNSGVLPGSSDTSGIRVSQNCTSDLISDLQAANLISQVPQDPNDDGACTSRASSGITADSFLFTWDSDRSGEDYCFAVNNFESPDFADKLKTRYASFIDDVGNKDTNTGSDGNIDLAEFNVCFNGDLMGDFS